MEAFTVGWSGLCVVWGWLGGVDGGMGEAPGDGLAALGFGEAFVVEVGGVGFQIVRWHGVMIFRAWDMSNASCYSVRFGCIRV